MGHSRLERVIFKWGLNILSEFIPYICPFSVCFIYWKTLVTFSQFLYRLIHKKQSKMIKFKYQRKSTIGKSISQKVTWTEHIRENNVKWRGG